MILQKEYLQVRVKNVACYISKQRMLWQQPLQLPPAVHPEGIQDGEKLDTGPR